jgi:VCBS repeat-containing protein
MQVQDASNGTVSLQGTKVVFTPNPGYTGPASFNYILSDGGVVGTVVINVTDAPPENSIPQSADDIYEMAEDGILVIAADAGVLANDLDDDGDPMAAILAEGPKNGTLVLQEDGSFRYVPNANFHGTDSFTYVANDGTANGLPTTVTIVVAPVNDAPVAAADSFVVAEDGTLNVSATQGVLANDSDVDGNSLTAQLVQGPANGQLTLNADGSFTYVPKANFAGTDSFTYQAKDGTGSSQTQTVSLTVTPVNDAPDAVNDALQTAYQTPIVRTAAQLLANDTDVDGNMLTLVSVGNAVNGTVSLANGSVTFTPTAGYSGAASYSYTVSDGQGGTDTATVSVQVGAPTNPGNDDIFYSTSANEVFDGGIGVDTISYEQCSAGSRSGSRPGWRRIPARAARTR